MKKITIRNNFIIVIVIFLTMIFLGIFISSVDKFPERRFYTTFKDLIPLVLALSAAWLGFCVQRRSAYQQQLRGVWSRLIEAVQTALQCTLLEKYDENHFQSAKSKLSIAIDEIRGVFCNLDETESNDGLYPFEPIKDIFFIINDLSHSSNFKIDSSKAKKNIEVLWKAVRAELLKEFDREVPTYPHSHWQDQKQLEIYYKNRIPRTPS